MLMLALTVAAGDGQVGAPSAKPVGRPMKAVNVDPSARVIADPAGLDFGIVPPHTLLEGGFKLVNTSDRPLKVMQAVPSCQCTTVDIVGRQIPARGTLDVPVTMKVSSTGLKVANVKVMVQDEPRPISLDLRAEVAYSVRVQVADAKGALQPFVDAVTDAGRLTGVATVSSVDGKPFRVLSVQGGKPAWPAGQGDEPRAVWQVPFDLPKAPCEQVPKYLIVETDRADARLVDARVRHECTRITPGIDIAEFRSNAGVMAPGAGANFDIEVKQLGQNRLGSVQSLDPRFKASLVSQKADGRSVMATVRLEPGPDVQGVFVTSVKLVAVDAEGKPFQTRRPEPPTSPGQAPRMLTLPAEAELLVFGKVE